MNRRGINNIFTLINCLLIFLVKILLIPFVINLLFFIHYHFAIQNSINIIKTNLLKGSVTYLNI